MPSTIASSTDKIVHSEPVNAWLLIGDEASYPSPDEVRRMRRRKYPAPPDIWTAPPQAVPGDLLLFYFMAPMKQVRFVARVGCHPYFDPSIGVNAVRAVDANQWWVTFTPLIEVCPVSFGELNEAWGGGLVLRGKPRHYLTPKVIAALSSIMLGDPTDVATPGLIDVLRVPVGNAELPNPSRVGLRGWSEIAPGVLKLESQVEEYVVDPLLRLALRGRRTRVRRQFRIPGAGISDHAVTRNGSPTAVIEAKVAVAEPRTLDWTSSPHFQQLMRYCHALGVPGMLIDSKRMFLVDLDASKPKRIIERRSATVADVKRIGAHLAPLRR